MPRSGTDEEALRLETAELAASLRAHLEWYESAGADGISSDSESPWGPAPEWPRTAPVRRAAASAPSRVNALKPRDRVEPAPAGRAAGAHAPVPHVRSVEGALPVAPPSAAAMPAVRAVRGEALSELALLEGQVKACTACVLHTQRQNTVFARGTGSSGLCFVGEGPGADEDARGLPFVGKAGQLLDRMIAAMGLDCDEVYVCNIVKCRPPKNRKPAPEEMAACAPYLARQLELLSPTVIVALGATAVEGLLGISGGITRMRGSWKLYKGSIAVMPTFHPAYLLRNPAAKRDVWEDLQAVLRHMGRSIPSRR